MFPYKSLEREKPLLQSLFLASKVIFLFCLLLENPSPPPPRQSKILLHVLSLQIDDDETTRLIRSFVFGTVLHHRYWNEVRDRGVERKKERKRSSPIFSLSNILIWPLNGEKDQVLIFLRQK